MKWTGWLFDNLGLKLFALLLAILLYLHVLTDRTVEETVDFPLVLGGLSDTLSLATAAPESVSVRLRGTGKQILQLRYLKPPVTIGLGDVGPGNVPAHARPGRRAARGHDRRDRAVRARARGADARGRVARASARARRRLDQRRPRSADSWSAIRSSARRWCA